MKPRLVMVGAGGHGLVTIELLIRLDRYELVGIVDDRAEQPADLLGVPVIGPVAGLADLVGSVSYGLVAVGDNAIRKHLANKVTDMGIALVPPVVHPASVIGLGVEVGIHSSVMAGAVINAGAVLSDGVIVNTGAIIEHDCYVGSYAHVCPGVKLGGAVRIGDGCLIGTGAVILPGLHIGNGAVVGAGAVVTRDVKPQMIVTGVPATVMNGRR